MYRPSYIMVDGNVLEHNINNAIKNYPDYKYYFGVVKNNAYHHGIYSIKYLIKGGINYLAVSSLEEALAARKYDLNIPILCLEPIKSEYIYDALTNNVSVTVGCLDEAIKINDLKLSDDLIVHFKVDSGMNRIGFKNKKEFSEAFELLKSNKHIKVEGIYTHLATSGIQDPNYNLQVENFLDITSLIDLKSVPIIHIDRSLTAVTHNKLDFVNGVRMGIMMYGYAQNLPEGSFIHRIIRGHNQRKYHITNVHLTNNLQLDYAFSLYSEVMEIRSVSKGEFCGYGVEFTFKNDSVIATIPVGYADGVVKQFGFVYINNKPYKIIAECMDMLMIEVDDTVKVGDKVEVIGEHQNIKTIGNRMGLSGYKMLNMFSNRLPIIYKYDDEMQEIKY